MSTVIPEHVERFIAAHISSIEALEVLLLLRGSPERAWAAVEIAREIRSNVRSIEDRLGSLAEAGFLVVKEDGDEIQYIYAPNGEEVSRVIDELATAYKELRHRVIGLIYKESSAD